MATYKVIQDIEAEDKLLGPLTLRQFIYAGISALCLYLSYIMLTKHVAFMLIIFMPVAFTSAFFAFPWGRDQPTELWALAKIRFMIKPRRRIWDQSGIKELVTITVPKKIEVSYTNGLSQTEVKSRLRALADTIDSRGWAVKNVNINLSAQPIGITNPAGSDRLIDISNLPQQTSTIDVQPADDIMDEHSNPVAQHFDQMITSSAQVHRQQIVEQLKEEIQQASIPPDVTTALTAPTPSQTSAPKAPPNNYWFMNQPQPGSAAPGYATFSSDPVVTPGTGLSSLGNANATPDEQLLDEQLKVQHAKPAVAYSHLRTLQPLSAHKPTAVAPVVQPVTPTPDPAILNLASNNDLNVATIARQAQKQTDESTDDEVVISLH